MDGYLQQDNLSFALDETMVVKFLAGVEVLV
jgi:hypothetical protein